MKSNRLLLISGFLSLIIFGCQTKNSIVEKSVRPNILLIVADDLGFTDLGCYGSEINTPNLDALALTGIRNTAFYTAPTCSPTRAMLLSGVDNHRNGYGTMEGNWAPNQVGVRGYEGHLNFDVVTFPELLKEKGYHTSIAGKWHQAYPATDSTGWPHQRGFNRSFCLLQGGAGHFGDQQRLFSFYKRTLYAENGQLVDQLPEDFYSSDYYTQKVISYIDESVAQNKPFFSYLAFTAPHWPLQVPEESIDLYKGRYDQGYEALASERMEKGKQLGIIEEGAIVPPLSPNVLPWSQLSSEEQKRSSRTMEIYAAMIARLDSNVGRLIEHLKSIGQYENTIIVFMADNGAEGNSIWGIADTKKWVAETYDTSFANMGRKNSYVFTGPSWAQVSTLPFQWYKTFSTEGGVRCPAIISYPQWTTNAGKINHDFISVMDLAPTFLEVAGVEHPGTMYNEKEIYPLDGISLVPWLEGKAIAAHLFDEVRCWELFGRRGVRQGDWKAAWLDAPYGNDAWELYNLKNDPGELNNLADENPEQLEALIKAWEAYEKKYNVILPNEKVAYGKEEVWRK